MAQAVEFHHLTSGVTNDARQAVIETQFLDQDGNPIDITGGGTGSTPAAGSVTPATLSGYDAATGHGKVPQVKADGSGFDFVAPPVGVKGDKGDPGAAGAKGDKGDPGAAGKSVTAIALTADAAGKITGGTVTFSDKTTAAITVTTATA
ncbi:hypothetical protein Uis1B_2232 [Bifidobacterium margollesii]|uniref:Collagen triple helix repeat (20 copies) n=1 Tax=Bifidobacterium margollesii TaxID=2020964 RepID=A0A2N5J6T4_9BIFI|nr:hypothetical protein [Bifidobacterium margollesii]PLS29929.1 hypothetical protein Uis1B_2232 [Bifidobacterium margollesii]